MPPTAPRLATVPRRRAADAPPWLTPRPTSAAAPRTGAWAASSWLAPTTARCWCWTRPRLRRSARRRWLTRPSRSSSSTPDASLWPSARPTRMRTSTGALLTARWRRCRLAVATARTSPTWTGTRQAWPSRPALAPTSCSTTLQRPASKRLTVVPCTATRHGRHGPARWAGRCRASGTSAPRAVTSTASTATWTARCWLSATTVVASACSDTPLATRKPSRLRSGATLPT
mmetsp:Transcript_53768/g.109351  ORF Transcript_53768/g.109351 Transcript_53768/m.109351 type:complete len:230 (-) Transcript_53768:159-848(-)